MIEKKGGVSAYVNYVYWKYWNLQSYIELRVYKHTTPRWFLNPKKTINRDLYNFFRLKFESTYDKTL